MKNILLILSAYSFVAFAETPMNPIFKGDPSHPQQDGPKQPIVKRPPQQQPQPAPTPRPEPIGPFFWEVLSWHQGGRNVTWAEIKGSYIGTCFRRSRPSQKWFSFLTYLGSQNNPEVLASKRIPLDVVIVNFNPIDLPSWNGRARDEYNSRIRLDSPTEILHSPTLTQKNPWLSAVYKVSGNYLVSLSTVIQRNHHLDGGLMYPGEIFEACYYTKKVAD